eukprot:COSAG01_NODE_7074_length_3365_cov_4.104409_1_plen_67_part_00
MPGRLQHIRGTLSTAFFLPGSGGGVESLVPRPSGMAFLRLDVRLGEVTNGFAVGRHVEFFCVYKHG